MVQQYGTFNNARSVTEGARRVMKSVKANFNSSLRKVVKESVLAKGVFPIEVQCSDISPGLLLGKCALCQADDKGQVTSD